MAQYPGSDTEFFIVKNGATSGPFKGLEELERQGVTPDMPVWYEGLPDWTPAMVAPLTRQLFVSDSPFMSARAESTAATPLNAPANTEPAPAHPYDTVAAVTPDVAKPQTFLVLSIVVTLIFNFIAGIVAIIFSCMVTSKWKNGDYQGAVRSSFRAQWWIAISITAGLIMMVANLLTGSYF